MDRTMELLTEETSYSGSSFEKSAFSNVSFKKSVYRSQNMSNSYMMLNNSDIMENSVGSYSNGEYVNGTQDGLSSIISRLQNLSLGYKHCISDTQLKRMKEVISRVNDAYVLWFTSQCVLDCYKSIERKVSPKLAKKLTGTLSSSTVQRVTLGKSRSGDKFNILGLTDDAVKISTQISFSEGEELNKCAMKMLRTNLEQLKSPRKALKDLFGSHCLKVVSHNMLVPEEEERAAQDSHYVETRLAEADRCVTTTNCKLQQLVQLSRRSECDARRAVYSLLHDKASCLNVTTSILSLKMEKSMCKDGNYTKAINTLGDRLKSVESEKSDQLKGLEKVLSKYERKMESSKQFSDIVSEYAKLKRQLEHKYQTLSVLNDPNISF